MKKRDILIYSSITTLCITCNLVFIILLNKGAIVLTSAITGMVLAMILSGYLFFYYLRNRTYYFEQVLDYMPSPISVTDINMKWTFINKPVEGFLDLDRNQVFGKHCSRWGAPICNTEKCGVHCLRKGNNESNFDQKGGNFEVNTNYIYNLRGKKIGHIEIVSEVTAKQKLSELIHAVKTDINRMTQELVQANNTQASSIEEISSSVEELTATIQQNSDNSQTTKQKANEVSRDVTESSRSVKSTFEAMKIIAEKISIIQDIAFQTNLLALNAAVEAARAGEQGRGFAVVAAEVRKLADNSKNASNHIVETVKNGLTKAENAYESLNSLIPEINKTAQLISEINSASQEQSSGTLQISNATQNVNEAVQETASMAERLGDTISNLDVDLNMNIIKD